MKPTAPKLIRWAGLSAMAAGIIFVVIQPIHPPDVLSSVTTDAWAIIQSAKVAMCILGLIGLTGLYARQANEAGWLGLAGYLLFSLFYALTLPFVFA
jgi:Na+/H+ antiporter NhaD/arsenite permease-like protein